MSGGVNTPRRRIRCLTARPYRRLAGWPKRHPARTGPHPGINGAISHRVTSREVVYMAFELMQSDEPLRWLAEADGYDLAEDMRRPSLGNCVYFVKGESTCSIVCFSSAA